ncbi:MAG: polyprenyl synthetase family protein [Bacteroidales bacterium]|jgi:octaprenyl-diphosphate synthase|nr:polyprenyl synthetase family protein [Bacteroidales bacterium]
MDDDIRQFERYFKDAVRSDIPFLSLIINYIMRQKGKQVRPKFVFLAARTAGNFCDDTFLAATSIELLHTATLTHDDVVDETYRRRSLFSINALWKNKFAVLAGDFLLAKGMLLNLDHERYDFLKLISRAVKDMSEGEILQMQKNRSNTMSFDDYYEVVRKKTASLIAVSMAIGAASVQAAPDVVERMYQIGLDAGTAFQIKDDIFDYCPSGLLGKPSGNDLREGKVTLPLLYALDGVADRRQLLQAAKNRHKTTAQINLLIDRVTREGGLQRATRQMELFRDRAINALADFPDSTAKIELIALLNYMTARDK